MKMGPYKFAIGIRYQPNFTLQDSTGRIVQEVIRGAESPFVDFFDTIDEGMGHERVLKNKKTGSYLMFTHTDTILEYYFDGDGEAAFSWLTGKALPFLFTTVIQEFKIKRFLRTGIILGARVDLREQTNQLVSLLTKDNLKGSDNFAIRFTKRLPEEIALVKRNVDDFRNIIVTLNRDEGVQFHTLDLDYQYYFKPDLEKFSDFDFIGFFKEAKERLTTNYKPLLEMSGAMVAAK